MKKKSKPAAKRTSRPLSVALVSLGCAKNLVDSEKMLGSLGEAGFAISAEPEGADFVIINTCAFIEAAREESREIIAEMLRLKKKRFVGSVVVAGCLPQRYREQLLQAMPGIDALAGVYRQDRIPDLLRELTGKQNPVAPETLLPQNPVAPDTARLRLTPRHYAYLRVSEGCDNRCSYCVIPDIRGPLRSKPVESVLAEAEELVADGARELIVIGQDTTSYGTDLYGEYRLPALLRQLAEIKKLRWLRVLYTHPAHYTDEFISLFAQTPKLNRYIDLPVQHASDKILTAMKRRVTRADLDSLLEKLRKDIPDVALRTSVIVGFPGETDKDFDALLDFMDSAQFDRLGAFAYSHEEGTPAAKRKGRVSEEVKQERLDEVMRRQQEISLKANARFVGKELEVVAEATTEDGHTVARSYREAPDVDGFIIVESTDAEPGTFFKVRITEAGPYDCLAVPVN
jgi:ribosomal protein S12 methylthiotransferase